MLTTPERIPGLLVLDYVEVSEFFFQMSMRPGVHSLHWVIEDQDTRLKPQLVIQTVQGFQNARHFGRQILRGDHWRADTSFRSDQALVKQT